MADENLDEKKTSNMAVQAGGPEQKAINEAIEMVNKGPENLTAEELSRVLKILAPFNNTNGAAGTAFVAVSTIANERLNSFADGKTEFSPEDADAFIEINNTLNPDKEEDKQKIANQAEVQKAAFDKENGLDSLTKESASMIEENYNAIEAAYKDFKPFAKDDKGKLLNPEFAISAAFFDNMQVGNTDKDSSTTKEDLQTQMLDLAMLQAQTDLSIDPAFKALSPEQKLKRITEVVSGNISTMQIEMIVAQKELDFTEKHRALFTKEDKTEADKAEIARLEEEFKLTSAKDLEKYNSGSGGGFRISSAVAISIIAKNSNANLSKAQRISEKTGFSKLWSKAKKFDAKMSEKHPKLWKMGKNIVVSATVGATTGGAGLAVLAAFKTYKVFKNGKKKFKESGEEGTYWQHLKKNPKEMTALLTSVAMTAVSTAFVGAEFAKTGLDAFGALGDAVQSASGVTNVATQRAIDAGTKAAIRGSISVSSSFVNAYDDIKKGNYKAAVLGIGTSAAAAFGGMYLAEHASEYTSKGFSWIKEKLGIEGADVSTEAPVATSQVGDVSEVAAPSEAHLNNMLLRNAERHPDLDMEKVYANLKAQGINNPEVAFYKLEQARLLAPNDPIMSEGDTNVRATMLRAIKGENLSEADMKIISTAQSNVQDGGFYTNDVRNMGGTGYSYRPNGVVQENTLDSHQSSENDVNSTSNTSTTSNDVVDEAITEAEPVVVEPAFDVSKLSDNEKILYTELESRYAESHGASATEMATITYLAHDELVTSGKFAEAEGLLRSTHQNFESKEAQMERAEAYKVEAGDNKGLIKSKMDANQDYNNYSKSVNAVKEAELELNAVKDLDRTDPTRIAVELKHATAVKNFVHDQQDMIKSDVGLYKDQIRHEIGDAKDLQDKAKDAIQERKDDNLRISKIGKELAKQGIIPNDSPELTDEYRVDKRLAKEYLKTALENKEHSDETTELLAENRKIMEKIANGPTGHELASEYNKHGSVIEALRTDLKAINNGDVSKLPGYNMDNFEDSSLAKAQTAVFQEHNSGTKADLEPAVKAPVHDQEPVTYKESDKSPEQVDSNLGDSSDYKKGDLVNISEKMRLFKAQVDKGLIPSSTTLTARNSAVAEVSGLVGKSITGEQALDHLEQKHGVDYDSERNVMIYKGKVFIDPLNNAPNSSQVVIYNEDDKALDRRGFGKEKVSQETSQGTPKTIFGKTRETR